jgi:hypothetical protein
MFVVSGMLLRLSYGSALLKVAVLGVWENPVRQVLRLRKILHERAMNRVCGDECASLDRLRRFK